MRKRQAWMLAIALMALAVSGCKNGNLFGGFHDRGDSGDPAILAAEAQIALDQGDYARALDLFERVLSSDPNNSEALYGAAQSAIGSSGLNLGVLISNVTKQTSSAPSFTNLTELIGQSREVIAAALGDSNSILNGIDKDALNAVIDTAICRLNKIVARAADGKISPDDIDLLMNLASLCVIRAVLKPLNHQPILLDVQNNNGNYTVEVSSPQIKTACTSEAAFMSTVARDLVGAWALFNRAVNLLNLQNDQIIARLRDDVATAAQKLLADGSTSDPQILPNECLNLFGPEITVSNFTSYDGVFTNPPSGC